MSISTVMNEFQSLCRKYIRLNRVFAADGSGTWELQFSLIWFEKGEIPLVLHIFLKIYCITYDSKIIKWYHLNILLHSVHYYSFMSPYNFLKSNFFYCQLLRNSTNSTKNPSALRQNNIHNTFFPNKTIEHNVRQIHLAEDT